MPVEKYNANTVVCITASNSFCLKPKNMKKAFYLLIRKAYALQITNNNVKKAIVYVIVNYGFPVMSYMKLLSYHSTCHVNS